MTFASESAVRSVRKRHVCDGCGKFIDIGQPATRWAGLTDGDFGTAIYHPDCRAAEVALNTEIVAWSYGDEWLGLSEIEDEDWPWLLEAHPAVAARMGITAERVAASA